MNDVLSYVESLSCIPHRLLNITFSYVIIRCIYIVYDSTCMIRIEIVRNCESALLNWYTTSSTRQSISDGCRNHIIDYFKQKHIFHF